MNDSGDPAKAAGPHRPAVGVASGGPGHPATDRTCVLPRPPSAPPGPEAASPTRPVSGKSPADRTPCAESAAHPCRDVVRLEFRKALAVESEIRPSGAVQQTW